MTFFSFISFGLLENSQSVFFAYYNRDKSIKPKKPRTNFLG